MREVSLHSIGLIQRIQEHDDFKSYMLNYINNNPIQRNDYDLESQNYVSNTDWYDSHNHKDREYVNEFRIVLEPYLRNIADRLYLKDMVMGNMWFQQYSHNSKHQWHNHEGCNWSAVYYVQMPDDKVKTLLWDYHGNKIVDEMNKLGININFITWDLDPLYSKRILLMKEL